ncbi:MAG: hypothetical protein J3K34DRAFT_401431 [Monoraphidium minutum]|nr:MAG: hypothetical protein J3K34DRAFT_401431 [Monoraphidium minutum]
MHMGQTIAAGAGKRDCGTFQRVLRVGLLLAPVQGANGSMRSVFNRVNHRRPAAGLYWCAARPQRTPHGSSGTKDGPGKTETLETALQLAGGPQRCNVRAQTQQGAQSHRVPAAIGLDGSPGVPKAVVLARRQRATSQPRAAARACTLQPAHHGTRPR